MPHFRRRAATPRASIAFLLASTLLGAFLVSACGGDSSSRSSAGRVPSRPTDSVALASTPAPAQEPAVVDTGPAMRDGHAIIRPEAVGPLHVGAWRRVAMSFVYAITSFSGPGDSEITPVHDVGKDTLTVVIVNDTVAQLEVMRPGAHTLDGFAVGTPIATLRAQHDATVGRDGAATTVRLARYCGITFSTADSSAHSGYRPVKGTPPTFPPDSAVVRTIIVGKCTGT